MRLPHHLANSAFFSFSEEKEFWAAVSSVTDDVEVERINHLLGAGLIPITSKEVLATMIGVNPGIIWSFVNRPHRHYRSFSIPKGRGERLIMAPKVGLKIIQKWISIQLQRNAVFPDHVYGFVPGRSHIDAAAQHTEASWIYSVDIQDFFPTTTDTWVSSRLMSLGYDMVSASLITSLCCYRGALAQGAPSSPVLSNISMMGLDTALLELANSFNIRVTRYADDITFSSANEFPSSLPERVLRLFDGTPWTVSKHKTHFAELPSRLKVHGLLVDGKSVKLTKGYRNKLRAYSHVMQSGSCRPQDVARLSGHIRYSRHIATYDTE